MHDQVQARLEALRKEMAAGQQRMQDLERQLAQVRDTMLRISGAIQVLEEIQALEEMQALDGMRPPSAASDATPNQDQDADELAEAM